MSYRFKERREQILMIGLTLYFNLCTCPCSDVNFLERVACSLPLFFWRRLTSIHFSTSAQPNADNEPIKGAAWAPRFVAKPHTQVMTLPSRNSTGDPTSWSAGQLSWEIQPQETAYIPKEETLAPCPWLTFYNCTVSSVSVYPSLHNKTLQNVQA